jgi:hypothetical protein
VAPPPAPAAPGAHPPPHSKAQTFGPRNPRPGDSILSSLRVQVTSDVACI